MSRILIYKFTLIIFLIISSSLVAKEKSYYQNSDEIIKLFKNGSVTEIYNQFDTTMQSKLSPPRLEPIWPQMQRNYGLFDSIGVKDTTIKENSVVINTYIHFEAGIMNMMLSWDNKTKKINGFYLKEIEKKPAIKYTNELPSYIDTTKFSIEELVIDSEFPISAELTYPSNKEDDKKTIFILNSGLGNYDKDLNIGPNKVFKNLAWGLSSIGYTVLRYDKVTYKYLYNLENKSPNYTIFDEFINPMSSAITAIKSIFNQKDYKLILLGHSEAAGLITFFNQDVIVNGYVLLMGSPNQPYLVELDRLTELFNLDRILTDTEKKLIKELELKIDYYKSIDKRNSIDLDSLPMNMSYEYLNSFDTIKPIKNLNNSKKPVLIINSKNDFEVSQKNYLKWFEELKSNENIKLVELENTSHILTEIEHKSTIKDYRKEAPISSIIFELINNWVLENERSD